MKRALSAKKYVALNAILGIVIGVLLLGCGSASAYVAQRGDTLEGIARSHNVTVQDLIEANQEQYPLIAADPRYLKPGMELTIPGGDDLGTQVGDWWGRLTCAASSPVTPMPAVPAARNEKISAIVQLIGQGINHERIAEGLKPLATDSNLARIAQLRSNDMIKRQYFSHNDPATEGVAFQELIRADQYKFDFAGENIAEIKNQGSLVPSCLTVYARYDPTDFADQFVTGWIKSPEHHENIVNPHFRRTGIALGVALDGTRVVASQLFSD